MTPAASYDAAWELGPGHRFGPLAGDRIMWYNPVLDPHCQAKMSDKHRTAVLDGTYDEGDAGSGGPLNRPDRDHPANLISSLCMDGLHLPALDIDGTDEADDLGLGQVRRHLPKSCELLAVRSAHHWHVYGSAPMAWSDYVDALGEMAEAGLLEEAYVAASVRRGQTLLRPPWLPKKSDGAKA